MPDSFSTIVVALLSVGGAAFIWYATRSYLAVRAGARSRERDAWDDMLDHNDYLDARARLAEMDRDYLRQALAYARWQLVTAGIEPNPREVVLPSERLAPGWRPTRRENGLRATLSDSPFGADQRPDIT